MRETALYCRESLLHRKYIACFVIDIHHTDKIGIVIAGIHEISRSEPSVIARRYPHHLKALALKVSGSLLNRSVLDSRNDYPAAISAICGRICAVGR